MNYRIIDRESYYRKGVFRHFSKDCKCSTSMTARIDVTDLVEYSQKTNTKFYINFLYILSKVMNSREDYRMGYLWQTEELICYDVINPTQYVFHDDTETFTLQRRHGNTGWIWKIIRTGLMLPVFRGFPMIRCMLNYRTAICFLRPL